MMIRKDPSFKKGSSRSREKQGASPVKQVAYVIDVYKSGELDSSRRASMRRRGSALLALTILAGLSGAILATILVSQTSVISGL